MSVQKFLDKIKNGRYGADITDAIIGGIKKCYDDASVNHDNANMEVKMARGTHNTLNDRLDNVDEIQAQTNAQLSSVSIFVAESNGIDDSEQIQTAIDKAHLNNVSVKLMCNQTYKINSTLKLKSNVVLDLNGSTLEKVNKNINHRILENWNFNKTQSSVIDNNIGVVNGVLVGNGDTLGVSDQGAAIGLCDVDGVKLENLNIKNTNGDGIQWRRADNVTIKDIVIGNFGRNGISPTSGLNTVWDNVKVIGLPIPGANPGKDIDAETNSATERGTHFANNIICKNITLVDFYNSHDSDFSQEWMFNNCIIGSSYNALQIKSTNRTNANIVINSNCRILSGGGKSSGILLKNVNGVIVNGCTIDGAGAPDGYGISIEGECSDLTIDNVKVINSKYELFVYGDNRLLNSKISNCDFGGIYLTGKSNIFKAVNVLNLTLNGTDTVNTFDVSSNIGGIRLLNGANISSQIFGSERGSMATSFYSRSEVVADGTTHDMVVKIPKSTRGRCMLLFAGYSHGGRIDHSASLLASITTGNLSTNVNIINSSGSKNIEIINVTQSEITLRLTYQWEGNFTVTLFG